MSSIRWRALLGVMLSAWGIFALLTIVYYRTTSRTLVYHFDDELRTHAGALASLVRRSGEQLQFQLDSDLLPFYRSSPKAEYFEVRDAEGLVLGRSESLEDAHLPEDWGEPESPHLFDLVLRDGRPGRAIGVRYALGAAAITIVVAEPRRHLDDALERLVKSSLWTVVGLGLALGMLVCGVLHLGLRPLRELSTRVAGLDANDLPGGLGMQQVPTELAPVVACLEQLLVRMRASIDRERRVTANIAHELQTPVAEIQTVSDVAMRCPDDVDYLRRAAAATNTTARRMGVLIARILELASVESHASAIRKASVDLVGLVHEVLAAVANRCAKRSIEPRVQAPPALVVVSDEVVLRTVLANLAQNAADHAPVGSLMEVEVKAQDPPAITFRNPAPDLQAKDLHQLIEPYWRKDAVRSPNVGTHAGIGLALANELARRLGGTLTIRLDGQLLVVSLCLPAASK